MDAALQPADGSCVQADAPAPVLSEESMDILHVLGYRVASDPVLFTKVVRIVGYAFGRHTGPGAPSEASTRIEQVAAEPFLQAQLDTAEQV